jgi:alkylation response protein AidB-like acyl-CoA dehydrogenase
MRFALDAEHGITEVQSHGLQNISMMSEHGHLMAEAADGVAARLADRDDDAVRYRLGRSMARIEAALSTPGMYGRVALIQTMREVAPELMDLLGAASALPTDTPGSADDGAIEFIFRHAVPAGIYGGTMEVFRNMIAQHELKLGKPSYGG